MHVDETVNAISSNASLSTIWMQQRNAVVLMGQALHDQLPEGDPPVTIHGRELDPETEGVGFQFQLTINDDLYQGKFQAAYFVVQIQLVKRKAGLGWQVDAMPVLEIGNANYDLYPKRSRQLAFRDRTGLERWMLDDLVRDAGEFFRCVRAGIPPQETATAFGAGRTTTVF